MHDKQSEILLSGQKSGLRQSWRSIVHSPIKLHDTVSTSLYLLEMFTGNFSLRSKVLIDVNDHGGDDAEEQPESEDDGVTNPCRKGGLSLGEKGYRSFIVQERWDDVVPVGQVDER